MIVGVQTRNSRASVASAWRPQSIALRTGAGSDDDEPPAAAASGGRRKSKAYLYKGAASGAMWATWVAGGSANARMGIRAPPPTPIVRALYDYEPQSPEELALREGDVVEVISTAEDPWWEGRIKSKSGMFPSNFVERI